MGVLHFISWLLLYNDYSLITFIKLFIKNVPDVIAEIGHGINIVMSSNSLCLAEKWKLKLCAW